MAPAPFISILFDSTDDCARVPTVDAPDFFVDLNINQMVDAITADWVEYDLKPHFHVLLSRIEAIGYRHEIMRDLENEVLFEHVSSFAGEMRSVRQHLNQAGKLHYTSQKQAWYLDSVEVYCEAVQRFTANLSSAALHSRGFLACRDYLIDYVASDGFNSLVAETKQLKADLADVRYSVLIKGDTITVRKYQWEKDYSTEIEAAFKRFQQGAVKDYGVKFADPPGMNHVEAKILEFVADLYPEIFLRLAEYCDAHRHFRDDTIITYDREIHFYIAYLHHIDKFKRAGLSFCYPRVSRANKEAKSRDGFDLALADKLLNEGKSIVCNDFDLSGEERIIVVTGPNQGGKTTFARTFGQLHYLAGLGLPVPGREARLFLFDMLLTHFEREERIESLRGKLQDDLVRAHAILDRATPNSIVIMNEIFTSTTLQDATLLSWKVMERIIELNLLCVWVTFVDELASFGAGTVSMVSAVNPENPTVRTFKILRKPADGLSFAMSIAEKYRLTYERVKERIGS
jgi:DNA mismatch repair protein MutS